MMGLGIGGALSSGGRKLMQVAILGGVGVAGLGAYGYTGMPDMAALSYVNANRPLFISLGVGAIALGAMLTWWSSQQMMKKMTGSIPSMMGMGGMAGMMGAGAMPGAAVAAVKVRCRSCGNLEPEAAKFCSSCGTAMA